MKKKNKKGPAVKKKVSKKVKAPKKTVIKKKVPKKTKIYPPSPAVMKRVSKKAKEVIKDLAKPKQTAKTPRAAKPDLGSAYIQPLNPRLVTEEAINVPVSLPKKLPSKRPTSTSSVRNYLSKKELLGAVMESKGIGRMSDDLAFKLQLLTDKYARSAQYARYTFNDDMRAYALMMLVRTWNSFNPEKSDNPFAFYTQCIKNSFIQYLNQEKRQRNIRDELLVDQGLSPSYTYQMEYEGSHQPVSEEDKLVSDTFGRRDDVVEPDHDEEKHE